MQRQLQFVSLLANLLDNQFNFFGFRFGMSVIIDLIPGFGDVFDVILSLYIVWIGIQLGVPATRVIQMLFNIAVNAVLGLIPFFGEVIYALRKVNLKNLRIIEAYSPKH